MKRWMSELMQARTDPKVKRVAGKGDAHPDGPDLDEGVGALPSVNRRSRASSRATTFAGFAVIILCGMGLILVANGKKTPKTVPEDARPISNSMPPLDLPTPAILEKPALPPAPAEPIQVIRNAPSRPDSGSHASGVTGKPEPTWQDRKKSGSLLVSDRPAAARPSATREPETLVEMSGMTGRNELSAKLEPTVSRGVSAQLLPDRNFLIAKGTTLECALETAIDSTVPGLTTCRLTRDVYSDNGRVVLLDRGSQLVGEYVGGLKNGQVRLFVLWSRAKTPNGVVVALNSPGADALGRAGHEGWVDNHFLERFGSAMLMSVLQDTTAAIIARQQGGNTGSAGTTINTTPYANSMAGGEKIIEKILDGSVNIPPTLIKNQGDRIQIMVARDLDFGAVYALRAVQ